MVAGETFDGFLIILGHDLLTKNENYFCLPSSIRKLYRDKNQVSGFRELTNNNLPEWYHFPMIFTTLINAD